MATNYFRRNPTDNADGILSSRKKLWMEGRFKDHPKDASRNNAYCQVTINGITLPGNSDTFASLYGRGESQPKPPPSLDSVTIETSGEWGHTIHVDVVFTCYLRSDFERFDKNWLRPGLEGSLRFGYVKPFNPSEQKSKTLSGLRVVYFSFNTDANSHYICNVRLVGVSWVVSAMDAKGGLKDSGKLKYKTKSIGGAVETHLVSSLDELLLYDAQENGKTVTDDLPDNHKVPNSFGDIVVYDPPDKAGLIGSINRVGGKLLGQLANMGNKQWTYHNEYYSLEYIVNRLVNDQLIGFLEKVTDGTSAGILKNIKIVCNSSVTVGYGYNLIRSADPTSMLILGSGKGKYKSDGIGKDWENDGEGGGSSIKCYKGDTVDLSKIMFERNTITTAIAHARAESEASGKDEQTKPNDRTDVLIYVIKFLKELFKTVSYNTGNLFQLDLIENPDNRNQLLVVDRNNGKFSDLKCFVFDPIDGDGSTRSMELNSNAGSKEYMAAMFGNVIKPSDINSTISNKMAEIDGKRRSQLADLQAEVYKKVNISLPDSGFATDDIEGLRTLFVKYNQLQSSDNNKQNQVILYPGLAMSVTLDGVWGYHLGCHIHTTLCPKTPYRQPSNGIAFNVQKVTHTFQNNDWETTLESILTFAKPITYI